MYKMIIDYTFISVGALAATVIIGGIYIFKHKQKNGKPKSVEYKCFFLTEDGIRGEENTQEVLLNMLTPVIKFIDEAETTLDLCFYIVSHISMVHAIIRAKERKVKVRIVTDHHTGIVSNKFTKYLYKEAIPIYAKSENSSQTIMHHKFLIRDNKTLLQASMNLTKNTSKGSYDNVLITDDPYLVMPFKEHFEELVVLFDVDDNSEE